MTTYIVELVDSVSQLFITWGWVYIQDNLGNEQTGITAGSGPTIGRVSVTVPGVCQYAAFGKDTPAGVKLYQSQNVTSLTAAPVVNQMWLTPLGQPESPYICVECGLAFPTQAELTQHHEDAHSDPPPPDPVPDPVKAGYCFIVTYANTSEAVLLHYRRFRDRCLPSAVVRFYYWLSPKMVRTFTGHEKLRKLLKILFTKLAGF